MGISVIPGSRRLSYKRSTDELGNELWIRLLQSTINKPDCLQVQQIAPKTATRKIIRNRPVFLQPENRCVWENDPMSVSFISQSLNERINMIFRQLWPSTLKQIPEAIALSRYYSIRLLVRLHRNEAWRLPLILSRQIAKLLYNSSSA